MAHMMRILTVLTLGAAMLGSQAEAQQGGGLLPPPTRVAPGAQQLPPPAGGAGQLPPPSARPAVGTNPSTWGPPRKQEASADPGESSVDVDRFQPAGARSPGHWAAPPGQWHQNPELQAVSSETRAHIGAAIGSLPDNQREVITLRDIDGLTSLEVCNLLKISDTNQRVLLHRARGKVRKALEAYVGEAR